MADRGTPQKLLLLTLAGFTFLWGQIGLEVNFAPYVSYYISSFDLNTGRSQVPIFTAFITNASYPDSVQVEAGFEIVVTSPDLGLDNEPLMSMATAPFWVKATIIISSQDLSTETEFLYDTEGNQITFSADVKETMDLEQSEELLRTVIQRGKLPNGIYTFRLSLITAGETLVEEQVLHVTTPTYIQLMSPGGVLADTALNEVFTPYPVFQWESDPCNVPGGCEYFIRLAEFDPTQHSTVEEAVESLTRLPLDQTQGWFPLAEAGVTSFQYPSTDAGDLEPGRVYVWQVKKEYPTTAGRKTILSEIYAFRVKDFTTAAAPGAAPGDPLVITLRSLIGEERYTSLLGPESALSGFRPNGVITLDGETIDFSVAQTLLTRGVMKLDSLGLESYHPLEVLSVEVEE